MSAVNETQLNAFYRINAPYACHLENSEKYEDENITKHKRLCLSQFQLCILYSLTPLDQEKKIQNLLKWWTVKSNENVDYVLFLRRI